MTDKIKEADLNDEYPSSDDQYYIEDQDASFLNKGQ
jgi:hypothetical protein